MLETISVKNIALIDELSLDFNAHLNVLTGETGAGKSILIGALSFLLGGKVTADIIRTGAAEAAVFCCLKKRLMVMLTMNID